MYPTSPPPWHCYATPLHVSPAHHVLHFFLNLFSDSAHLTPSLLSFSSLIFVLSLHLHPVLSQILLLLVYVTLSFLSFPSLHPPFFFIFLLWMDRLLFTTGNVDPALLTNQQEEISARDKDGMLVFLTASHVSLSGSHVCSVCVNMCDSVLYMGCCHHRQRSCCWRLIQICHTGGQKHIIRSALIQIWSSPVVWTPQLMTRIIVNWKLVYMRYYFL